MNMYKNKEIYPLNSSQIFHFITIGEAVNEFEFDPKAISLIYLVLLDLWLLTQEKWPMQQLKLLY